MQSRKELAEAGRRKLEEFRKAKAQGKSAAPNSVAKPVDNAAGATAVSGPALAVLANGNGHIGLPPPADSITIVAPPPQPAGPVSSSATGVTSTWPLGASQLDFVTPKAESLPGPALFSPPSRSPPVAASTTFVVLQDAPIPFGSTAGAAAGFAVPGAGGEGSAATAPAWSGVGLPHAAPGIASSSVGTDARPFLSTSLSPEPPFSSLGTTSGAGPAAPTPWGPLDGPHPGSGYASTGALTGPLQGMGMSGTGQSSAHGQLPSSLSPSIVTAGTGSTTGLPMSQGTAAAAETSAGRPWEPQRPKANHSSSNVQGPGTGLAETSNGVAMDAMYRTADGAVSATGYPRAAVGWGQDPGPHESAVSRPGPGLELANEIGGKAVPPVVNTLGAGTGPGAPSWMASPYVPQPDMHGSGALSTSTTAAAWDAAPPAAFSTASQPHPTTIAAVAPPPPPPPQDAPVSGSSPDSRPSWLAFAATLGPPTSAPVDTGDHPGMGSAPGVAATGVVSGTPGVPGSDSSQAAGGRADVPGTLPDTLPMVSVVAPPAASYSETATGYDQLSDSYLGASTRTPTASASAEVEAAPSAAPNSLLSPGAVPAPVAAAPSAGTAGGRDGDAAESLQQGPAGSQPAAASPPLPLSFSAPSPAGHGGAGAYKGADEPPRVSAPDVGTLAAPESGPEPQPQSQPQPSPAVTAAAPPARPAPAPSRFAWLFGSPPSSKQQAPPPPAPPPVHAAPAAVVQPKQDADAAQQAPSSHIERTPAAPAAASAIEEQASCQAGRLTSPHAPASAPAPFQPLHVSAPQPSSETVVPSATQPLQLDGYTLGGFHPQPPLHTPEPPIYNTGTVSSNIMGTPYQAPEERLAGGTSLSEWAPSIASASVTLSAGPGPAGQSGWDSSLERREEVLAVGVGPPRGAVAEAAWPYGESGNAGDAMYRGVGSGPPSSSALTADPGPSASWLPNVHGVYGTQAGPVPVPYPPSWASNGGPGAGWPDATPSSLVAAPGPGAGSDVLGAGPSGAEVQAVPSFRRADRWDAANAARAAASGAPGTSGQVSIPLAEREAGPGPAEFTTTVSFSSSAQPSTFPEFPGSSASAPNLAPPGLPPPPRPPIPPSASSSNFAATASYLSAYSSGAANGGAAGASSHGSSGAAAPAAPAASYLESYLDNLLSTMAASKDGGGQDGAKDHKSQTAAGGLAAGSAGDASGHGTGPSMSATPRTSHPGEPVVDSAEDGGAPPERASCNGDLPPAGPSGRGEGLLFGDGGPPTSRSHHSRRQSVDSSSGMLSVYSHATGHGNAVGGSHHGPGGGGPGGRAQFAALQQHIDELTEEKLALQRGLQQQVRLNTQLAEENEELTRQYNARGATVEELERKIKQYEQELEAQALSLEGFSEERQAARTSFAEASSRAQALASEVVGLEAQVLQLKSAVLKAERAAEESRERARKLEKQVDTLTKEAASRSQELQQMQLKGRNLVGMLKQTEAKLQAAEEKLAHQAALAAAAHGLPGAALANGHGAPHVVAAAHVVKPPCAEQEVQCELGAELEAAAAAEAVAAAAAAEAEAAAAAAAASSTEQGPGAAGASGSRRMTRSGSDSSLPDAAATEGGDGQSALAERRASGEGDRPAGRSRSVLAIDWASVRPQRDAPSAVVAERTLASLDSSAPRRAVEHGQGLPEGLDAVALQLARWLPAGPISGGDPVAVMVEEELRLMQSIHELLGGFEAAQEATAAQVAELQARLADVTRENDELRQKLELQTQRLELQQLQGMHHTFPPVSLHQTPVPLLPEATPAPAPAGGTPSSAGSHHRGPGGSSGGGFAEPVATPTRTMRGGSGAPPMNAAFPIDVNGTATPSRQSWMGYLFRSRQKKRIRSAIL